MKRLNVEQVDFILNGLSERLIDGIKNSDYMLLSGIFSRIDSVNSDGGIKYKEPSNGKSAAGLAIFNRLLEAVAYENSVSADDIKNGRTQGAAVLRRCLFYIGAEKLKLSASNLAGIFKMTRQGVSAAIKEATAADQAGYDQHANIIERCAELLGDIMGELQESMKNANNPK